MFPFKKPPSRVEVAKKTVADAVHSLSDSVADVAATLSDKAHELLDSAGDLVETHAASAAIAGTAAGVAAGAAEKLGALKAGAVGGAALAGKAVADKVAAIREPHETATEADVPDVRAAHQQAQDEINTMNKQAKQYKRELEQELARQQQFYQAESERLRDEYEQLQAEAKPAKKGAVRVPVAPTDEVIAYDEDGEPMEDFDYDYDENQSGGGKGWLVFGGLLLAGAGAVYYLFSSTGGRRQRAAIQDRVGQVAQGVREKVTHDSDETGEATVGEIAEAATGAFDRSNEKIADASESAGANAEGLPGKAVEKLGEVGDKVAGGIASAGAFLADKLEAAGAGAKDAAHSAAEKLDEAKDKTVARLDETQTPPATTTGAASLETGAATPDAVIIEIINDEPRVGESPEAILAEVEATVKSIEDSVREEKK